MLRAVRDAVSGTLCVSSRAGSSPLDTFSRRRSTVDGRRAENRKGVNISTLSPKPGRIGIPVGSSPLTSGRTFPEAFDIRSPTVILIIRGVPTEKLRMRLRTRHVSHHPGPLSLYPKPLRLGSETFELSPFIFSLHLNTPTSR